MLEKKFGDMELIYIYIYWSKMTGLLIYWFFRCECVTMVLDFIVNNILLTLFSIRAVILKLFKSVHRSESRNLTISIIYLSGLQGSQSQSQLTSGKSGGGTPLGICCGANTEIKSFTLTFMSNLDWQVDQTCMSLDSKREGIKPRTFLLSVLTTAPQCHPPVFILNALLVL